MATAAISCPQCTFQAKATSANVAVARDAAAHTLALHLAAHGTVSGPCPVCAENHPDLAHHIHTQKGSDFIRLAPQAIAQ